MEILKKYKDLFKNKKYIVVFIIVAMGILLMNIPKQQVDNNKIKPETKSIEEITEEKLTDLLLSIDGVKKVKVMICFKDRGVKEYYKDEIINLEDKTKKTDSKVVLKRTDRSEEPVLRREKTPEIKGVTVVCDCNNYNLKKIIYRAVLSSLGTEPHKIEIIINKR